MKQSVIDLIESVASSIDGHARVVTHARHEVNDLLKFEILSLKDKSIIEIEVPCDLSDDSSFIRYEIAKQMRRTS